MTSKIFQIKITLPKNLPNRKNIMIKNEFIHERQWLSHDDKKQILKKTHSKCACCGKQLTIKNMTVEHIIPISRGGSYVIKNLIALCEDCNLMKGNMLYRPEGFYLYAINEPCYTEMQKIFEEWFDTVYKDFNICLYPLISPKFNTLFIPLTDTHHWKNVIAKQLMLNWSYVGKDRYEEMEAITNIKITDLRKETNILHDNYIELLNPNKNSMKKIIANNQAVAVYSMQKISTSKYLALISVLVDIEKKIVSVHIPWTDLSSHYEPWAVYYFVNYLMQSLDNYAHVDIREINIFAKTQNQLEYFTYKEHDFVLGIASTTIKEFQLKTIPNANYACFVIRSIDANNSNFNNMMLSDKYDMRTKLSKIRQNAFQKRLDIAEERYQKAHNENL